MQTGADRLNERQAQAVQAHIQALLRSQLWRQAPRLQRLLERIVQASLAEDGDALSGQSLARTVFDKGPDFDPAIDPIVRVEAGRLRNKLLAYYACEGMNDPVRIDVPKGGYRATFAFRDLSAHPARIPLASGIGQFWSLDAQGLLSAQESFARAVARDPEYAAAHAWLARVAANRHGLSFDRTGKSIALAERHAQRALELEPNSTFVHASRCATLLWSGRPADAVSAGRRSVALDPNYADGHALLALALANAMQLDAALEEIELAFQMSPVPVGYYHWIKGANLHLMRQLDAARASHASALSCPVTCHYSHVGLALCLLQSGDRAGAEEHVRLFRAWYRQPTLFFRNRFSDPLMRARHAAAMRRLGFIELPVR